MSVLNRKWGATQDLTVEVTERRGGTATVSSATITIKSTAGAAIRSAVACTIDTPRAYYTETFSTGNAYTEGAEYDALFLVTMSDSQIIPYELRFKVESVNNA